MVYTSETIQGQVYVPAANWIRASSSTPSPIAADFHDSYDSYHHCCRHIQEQHSNDQRLWVRILAVSALTVNILILWFARFAVATVMFSTTILLAVQMFYVKRWPLAIAIGFLVIFGFFDGMLVPQNSRCRPSF
jgi:KUP system potassium uptake protein